MCLQVTDRNHQGVLDACGRMVVSGNCDTVVTLNSLMIMKSWHDERMAGVILRASLITADSVGISLASLILDRRMVRRYPGIEMMEDIIARGWKVFFLGSRDGVASTAAMNMKKKYPCADICGTYHGFFSVRDCGRI